MTQVLPLTRSIKPDTMADVINAVRTEPKFKPSRRRDLVSSTGIFCRWLGHEDPAAVPADLRGFEAKIGQLHPARFGVTPQRFSRIKSDVRAALEYAGAPRAKYVRLAAFHPGWAALLGLFPGRDALEESGARARLARAGLDLRPLMGALSLAGIGPCEVTPADVEARYFARLHNDPWRSAQRRAERIGRVRGAWNVAQAEIPAFPQFTLPNLERNPPLTIPLSAFPESFQADVAKYQTFMGLKPRGPELMPNAPRLARLRARRGTGRPSNAKMRRPLKSATLDKHVHVIMRASAALVRAGEATLNEIESIADVATVDAAACLADEGPEDSDLKSDTWKGYVHALRSVAVRWREDVERHELDEFNELSEELTVYRSDQMTDRVRERLARFTPAVVARLSALPREIMEEVKAAYKANGRRPVNLALARRACAGMGLWLELRLCPRSRTLAGTHLDRNFIQHADGTATLRYGEHETKTGQVIAAELDREEVRNLKLYEVVCLPALGARGNRHLYPSQEGGGTRAQATLARMVCRLVRESTGLPIHLHLFRHILATQLLRDNPKENRPLATALLGHRPNSVSTYKYAEILSGWATDAVKNVIDKHLAELPSEAARKGPLRRERHSRRTITSFGDEPK